MAENSTEVLASESRQRSTVICPLCGLDLERDVCIIHKHWMNNRGHKKPRVIFERGTIFCTVDDCLEEFTDSHAAYTHISDHFRRRMCRQASWIVTDLTQDNPDDSTIDQVEGSSPLLNHYPNRNDFAFRTLKEQKAISNCTILLLNSSENQYEEYVNILNGLGSNFGRSPKSLKTIKATVWKLFKGVFELKTHIIPNPSPKDPKFHMANICQVIHMWINNNTCLEVIRDRYLKSTEPYLENIDSSCANYENVQNRTYSGNLFYY